MVSLLCPPSLTAVGISVKNSIQIDHLNTSVAISDNINILEYLQRSREAIVISTVLKGVSEFDL